MRYEASPRARCHHNPHPRRTLARRTVTGSRTHTDGLDISLHEVVVLGLITCEEAGLVSRPHLLFGGIRSVTTVLKEVEEEQKGLREIKGEWEEEEVGWNGELKVEE